MERFSTCRSTFDSIMEAQCFQGIVDWMNVAATSKKYPHAPITSWFYWAYNPDSGGEACTPGNECSRAGEFASTHLLCLEMSQAHLPIMQHLLHTCMQSRKHF